VRAQEQPGACAGCPSVVTMDLGLEGLPEAQQKELTQRIEEMQVKDRCAGTLASRPGHSTRPQRVQYHRCVRTAFSTAGRPAACGTSGVACLGRALERLPPPGAAAQGSARRAQPADVQHACGALLRGLRGQLPQEGPGVGGGEGAPPLCSSHAWHQARVVEVCKEAACLASTSNA